MQVEICSLIRFIAHCRECVHDCGLSRMISLVLILHSPCNHPSSPTPRVVLLLASEALSVQVFPTFVRRCSKTPTTVHPPH